MSGRAAGRLLLTLRVLAVSAGLSLAWLVCSAGTAAPMAPAVEAGITVAAASEPLVDLLPELSDRKLVPHRELGERRVHVHVQRASPAEARRAVAAVVGGVWVKTEGSPALRLEPDADAERETTAIRLMETKDAARWAFTSDAGTVESTVTFPSPAHSPFGGGGFGGGGFGPPPGGFPKPAQ